ncbi:MAG TPA: NAD regulator [Hyphomicrobium sp.]|nr:NAD regulator [Hyphomicrobium sp.]
MASEADPATVSSAAGVEIGLNAAIVAVTDNEPVVLVIRSETDKAGATDGLPFGTFSPLQHRTFEGGLRAWVHRQTGLELGYAEQLYTFGDRGRHAQPGDVGPHVVSIGYLALTQTSPSLDLQQGSWRSWYHYFPWEDWRRGRPEILEATIEPKLREWVAAQRGSTSQPISRQERVRICFALEGAAWDEEKVLDRYELLYEAGLVDEAARDGREAARQWTDRPRLGVPMHFDHRRILATAIGRVRAKIKYRPVIFELMPDDFTLFELQRTVEAILGPHLHKQNFRRLVEGAGLVEPTGEVKMRTGGRPAKLYRFRREVLLERPAPGVRVKPGKV